MTTATDTQGTVIAGRIVPVVPKQWLENLRHMVGAEPRYKKSQWGFRNHFCAAVEGEDIKVLRAMESAGLVHSGMTINDGRDQYFHITYEGCRAIELGPAATRRAMGI